MRLPGAKQCFSGSKAIVSSEQSYRFLLEKHCFLKRMENRNVPNVLFCQRFFFLGNFHCGDVFCGKETVFLSHPNVFATGLQHIRSTFAAEIKKAKVKIWKRQRNTAAAVEAVKNGNIITNTTILRNTTIVRNMVIIMNMTITIMTMVFIMTTTIMTTVTNITVMAKRKVP